MCVGLPRRRAFLRQRCRAVVTKSWLSAMKLRLREHRQRPADRPYQAVALGCTRCQRHCRRLGAGRVVEKALGGARRQLDRLRQTVQPVGAAPAFEIEATTMPALRGCVATDNILYTYAGAIIVLDNRLTR